MKDWNNWIVKNRIIRRSLVYILTALFVCVTLDVFKDLSSITTQGVAAWTVLVGLEREILRFFLQGTKEEADND